MKRSRIDNRFKKQSQKTLILSVLGITLVLILIIKLGIPFVVTVGGLFERTSPKTTSKSTDLGGFIAQPTLDDLPNATMEENLKITGVSSPNVLIELFVNGDKEDETQTKEDSSFNFEIDLSEGDNIIKARARKDQTVSEFSRSQAVLYKNSPPKLSIDSPSDSSTTSNDTITVSGKTDEGVNVTVNDFWAVLSPDNSFSYNLRLNQGGNKIKIVAQDEAGNKTEKEISVTYSP